MTHSAGLIDIIDSLGRWRVALYLAWSDTRARYRRSVLGPFWLTIGTAIGVAGLGLLWSELLKVDRANFVPSLTAGLIIWQFISGCITESAALFLRQGNVIRNLQLPYFLHPLQLVLRHLVTFAHNIIVFVIVALLMKVPVTWGTFWVIPGFALLLLNLLWLALLFGMIGARFRDIEYALAALMPLLFFVSPVLYRPEYLPFSAWMIWLNPFSHLIEIVRSPLLGAAPPMFTLLVALSFVLIGWSVTLALFNTRRSRIAFWV